MRPNYPRPGNDDPLGPEPTTGNNTATRDFARALVAAEHKTTNFRLIIGAVFGAVSIIASASVGSVLAVQGWATREAKNVTGPVVEKVGNLAGELDRHKVEEANARAIISANVLEVKQDQNAFRVEVKQNFLETRQDIRDSFKGLKNDAPAPRLEKPPKPVVVPADALPMK